MGMNLVSHAGRYQWDARVRGRRPGGGDNVGFDVLRVTVFCDDRDDAVREACAEAVECGWTECTLNHITKVESRQ